jgi:hypothetical protein
MAPPIKIPKHTNKTTPLADKQPLLLSFLLEAVFSSSGGSSAMALFGYDVNTVHLTSVVY